MTKLLLTAATLLAFATPAFADQGNATAAVYIAFYNTKCSTPLPQIIKDLHKLLIKNHDYTSEQEMNALVDVAFSFNKTGAKLWCSTSLETIRNYVAR